MFELVFFIYPKTKTTPESEKLFLLYTSFIALLKIREEIIIEVLSVINRLCFSS
jgi:hypothetical protein